MLATYKQRDHELSVLARCFPGGEAPDEAIAALAKYRSTMERLGIQKVDVTAIVMLAQPFLSDVKPEPKARPAPKAAPAEKPVIVKGALDRKATLAAP